MKSFYLALALAFLLGSTAVRFANAKGQACPFKEESKLRTHLAEHVTYPSTGKQVKETCKKEMPDEFSKEERQCVEKTLSDKKTYRSSKEVLADLGLKK